MISNLTQPHSSHRCIVCTTLPMASYIRHMVYKVAQFFEDTFFNSSNFSNLFWISFFSRINDDKHQANSANEKTRCNPYDLEIAIFLKVARSIIVKVCKELVAADSTTAAKRKTPSKSYITIRTPTFVWKVQKIIDKSPRKPINTIAKELNVSRYSTGRIMHKNLLYKSDVMRRGQFASANTKASRLIRAKHLSSKLKHLESLMKKTLLSTKGLNKGMLVGYAETLRTFQ